MHTASLVYIGQTYYIIAAGNPIFAMGMQNILTSLVAKNRIHDVKLNIATATVPSHLPMQTEVFAEVGEIIGGTKTLPKVPECGKKFIMFKSLGN